MGLRTWRVLRGEGTAEAEAEDDIPKGRPVRCGFVVVVLLPWRLTFVHRPGSVPRSIDALVGVVGCVRCGVLCALCNVCGIQCVVALVVLCRVFCDAQIVVYGCWVMLS